MRELIFGIFGMINGAYVVLLLLDGQRFPSDPQIHHYRFVVSMIWSAAMIAFVIYQWRSRPAAVAARAVSKETTSHG